MKIFTPTRGQKKTELPPEPHRQNRQNLDAGGSVSSGGDGVAVIPEKNALEPHSRAPKNEMQTAGDQPRPAQTSTSTAPHLEPLTIWAALHAAIPDCLEVIRKDGHLIAWLEFRTPSKYWVSTPPVSADRVTLERLVLTIAAHNQDALNAAIKSARGLHPDINPARQEVAQRARFSRKEVSA